MQNPFSRSSAVILVFIASGFALGAVAWSGYFYALALLILYPVGLSIANNRDELVAFVAAYHAGATWTLVPGAQLFFGNRFHPLSTLLLWIGLVAILSLPYLFLRPSGKMRLVWGVPAVMVLTAFLPTGIANPITAAGALFPGTSWFGLALTLVAFGAITTWRRYTAAAVFALALVCNVSCLHGPTLPSRWRGENTLFGGSGLLQPSPKAMYETARLIQERALASEAPVIVFPETVVHRWNSATDLFWEDTFAELRTHGRTMIVGAAESLPGGKQYRNVLMIRGAERGTFVQRVPLPYAMWRPLSKDGVPLNMLGPATVSIGRDRVAPIICYEQLLVFPILSSMTQRPTILIGVANDYWARGTYIAEIQRAALTSWSRLFWVPVVSAVNQ